MKKTLLVMAAALAVLFSCDDDSYRHAIGISYPNSGQYGAVYADQLEDSIVFYTYDSYNIYTDVEWITVNSDLEYMTVENSYYYMWEFAVPLYFTANKSGETRTGVVYVHNYGNDWDKTATASYLQFSWLNITYPSPTYPSYSSYPLSATFSMTDTCTQAVDSLKFTAYGDWTLTTDNSFVSFSKESGTAGSQVITLALENNEATEDRTANITLTSNGVSSDIKLTQTGAEEE